MGEWVDGWMDGCGVEGCGKWGVPGSNSEEFMNLMGWDEKGRRYVKGSTHGFSKLQSQNQRK